MQFSTGLGRDGTEHPDVWPPYDVEPRLPWWVLDSVVLAKGVNVCQGEGRCFIGKQAHGRSRLATPLRTTLIYASGAGLDLDTAQGFACPALAPLHTFSHGLD